jgi:CHAD domain-containing protein
MAQASQYSAGEAVHHALIKSIERVIQFRNVTPADDDSKGIHQARVATRELRSNLKTFSALFDSEWVYALRAELRVAGQRLGAVRDSEVLLQRLQSAARKLDKPGSAAPLWTLLEEEIAERRTALLDMLRSAEYHMMERQLVDAVQTPPLTAKADAPAVGVLPDLVDQCWRRLKSCHRSFDNRPDDTQLHALRIEAKRVRYAAEASAEACGKPAAKLGSRAADLQDVLGDLHDSIIAAHWLRKVQRNPDGAEAASDLHAMQVAAARKYRRAWPRAWKALDRKQLRPLNW